MPHLLAGKICPLNRMAAFGSRKGNKALTRRSIFLFIVPPSGIFFFHAMAYFSVLVGLGLGWAWGVIVMKAGLATRPASEVQAKYADLEDMAKTAPVPAEFVSSQLLQGYMLDTRVSVTYYCLIGLFIYLMVCFLLCVMGS